MTFGVFYCKIGHNSKNIAFLNPRTTQSQDFGIEKFAKIPGFGIGIVPGLITSQKAASN